jgi:mandelate racemase
MTLPAVRSVDVRAVNVPLDPPIETGSGVIGSAPLVLVDLTTSEGVVGRSYIFAYTPAALAPAAMFVRNLAPLIVGEALAPLELETLLHMRLRLLGAQGLAAMAMAALDMAAWDACAKHAGLPLAVLLGGKVAPVAAYASLRSMGLARLEQEAQAAADQGFVAAKLKLGPADPSGDLAAIKRVRAIMGARTAIMVDFNQSLDVRDAIARARALDDANLTWIEEPTLATEFGAHARIAAAISQPVQIGENWWGPSDAAKSLAAKASAYAMPDAMKIGGVGGWQRTAALCAAHGVPVSSHLFVEISAHLLAATPGRHYLEYLDMAGPILAAPAHVEDGCVWPSSAPGTGIAWNEDAVERYAVD